MAMLKKKKSPTKAAAAKKKAASPSLKTATKKKKAGIKKPITKKPGLKKPLAKKTPVKKTVAKKTVAKKTPVKKAAPKAAAAPPKAAAGIDTVEISLYPSKSYSEEYQVTGFHYALLSPDMKMCHHWIKCRDFLQDALRNQLTGRKDQIYGFNYNPASDPPCDVDVTRIAVKRIPTPNTDALKKDFDEMMLSALGLLNYYEKKHDLGGLSVMVKAKHSGNDQYIYYFQGPGIWSQGAVMIAMYTFLIRIGHFKPQFTDEKSLRAAYESIISHSSKSNDTRYLKTVYKNLDLALEHREKHLFIKPGAKKGDKVLFHDSPMSSFHHHSGIVSLSQFNTPEKGLNDEFRKIFSAAK